MEFRSDKVTAGLTGKGIETVFRENDEGRIYGATFIDHMNREVYNGSRLGNELSANAFERLFNKDVYKRQAVHR